MRHDGAVDDDAAPGAGDERFVAMRPKLIGVAYRLLGTTSDAEDTVQEAWLRWRGTDREVIENPDAWLTTVVTRLALDRLRRRKREQDRYVGPWLPSPVVERVSDPTEVAELADSMTTAFLLLLERLSPDERAAFLLSDVFGEPYDVVADAMDRSEQACRQLSSRARRKLREGGAAPRRTPVQAGRVVVERFLAAIATGDEAAAIACVAPHAVLTSDGGSRRRAARRPVIGPERIVRLIGNIWRRVPSHWHAEPAVVGGLPGLIVVRDDGAIYLATGIEVTDGEITAVYSVLNPDKLAGTTELAAIAGNPP